MGAKLDESKSSVVRVRLTPSLRLSCIQARAAGAWSARAESDFMGYLLELGITRYRKSILPIERGDDLEPRFTEERPSSAVS